MFQSEGGREGFRDCGWDCGVALALPLALEPFRGGGDSTEALDVDAFAELVSLVPFALDLASFFDLLLEAAAGAFVAFEELGSLG